MLDKIMCNPMHPFYGALPMPYVPVRVTRSALVAYRYTYAHPRCRISQYRWIFIPLYVSQWDDLVGPVLDGVGLASFNSRANDFFGKAALSLFVFYYFSLSLLSVYRLVSWGCSLWTDRV